MASEGDAGLVLCRWLLVLVLVLVLAHRGRGWAARGCQRGVVRRSSRSRATQLVPHGPRGSRWCLFLHRLGRRRRWRRREAVQFLSRWAFRRRLGRCGGEGRWRPVASSNDCQLLLRHLNLLQLLGLLGGQSRLDAASHGTKPCGCSFAFEAHSRSLRAPFGHGATHGPAVKARLDAARRPLLQRERVLALDARTPLRVAQAPRARNAPTRVVLGDLRIELAPERSRRRAAPRRLQRHTRLLPLLVALACRGLAVAHPRPLQHRR